jgi:pentapeptide MXKDX repeat protein
MKKIIVLATSALLCTSAFVFAANAMSSGTDSPDSMKKDAMSSPDSMKKDDSMSKDSMKKDDAMSGDSMNKTDSMSK